VYNSLLQAELYVCTIYAASQNKLDLRNFLLQLHKTALMSIKTGTHNLHTTLTKLQYCKTEDCNVASLWLNTSSL